MTSRQQEPVPFFKPLLRPTGVSLDRTRQTHQANAQRASTGPTAGKGAMPQMSQIHSFILSRLPDGDAKEKFLRSLIDFDTPETQRGRTSSNQSIIKSMTTRSSSRSSVMSSNVCFMYLLNILQTIHKSGCANGRVKVKKEQAVWFR